MSFERTLLQLTKHRKYHEKYSKLARVDSLDIITATILADQGRYFREHEGLSTIESGPFFQWFRDFAHPTLGNDKYPQYKVLIDSLTPDVAKGVEEGFMERLLSAGFAKDLLDVIDKYHKGEEVDIAAEVERIKSEFELVTSRKVKTPEVLEDIEDLLVMDRDDVGLHWRLECLNMSMTPLRGGDFVVVAARPDQGKTTFMTSELTYMVKHLDTLFPEEKGRPAVWFNNEGPGAKIKRRCVQSALNLLGQEMVDLAGKPSTDGKSRSLLMQKFNEETHGGFSRIRIMDVHDFWSHEVEAIIKNTNAGLVVFDMVDNFKFGGTANNNGQRTDQLLEAMYQWARIIAVKYDCVVIAMSQISADGDGLQYPTLSMLKDSKTGKQGAADVIITIGSSHEPHLVNARWIGCTKNKKVRDDGKKDPRCEVVFDGIRGRYNMPGL